MKTSIYNTDSLMRNVWGMLLSDFRVTLKSDDWLQRQYSALYRSTKDFRSIGFPNKFVLTPYLFKMQYQLENLFKRYIFTDDVFNKDQLRTLTQDSFLSFQESIAKPLEITTLNHRVLQGARSICRNILGKYDPNIHMSLCQFGKRAAVDVPYTQAYLDQKIGKLNGSLAHIKWFRKYLESDKLLKRISCRASLIRSRIKNREHYCGFPIISALKLSCVPKSFKTDRGIMPNSVIGSFYSYGLGRYVQERLVSVGLNIKHLQEKHGVYAKVASKTRHLVTGDLSKASDGPTAELVNRIIPRDWYNAFKNGRISNVIVDGKQSQLASFMAMGIGFTFTLETLIFYSLLKSIAKLTDTKGLISVYGDDLIYPRSMHKFVKVIFPSLRILMNDDKTFVDTHFRESCGSDYFHGVDVRPFQPEQVGGDLTKQEYVSFLYKMYNGLTKRWDPVEIPLVLSYLRSEIVYASGRILQVPPSFPADAGLHVEAPIKKKAAPWFESWSCTSFNSDLQCVKFQYLRQVHKPRKVVNEDVYYWENLRARETPEESHPFEPLRDNPLVTRIGKKKKKDLFVLDKMRHSKIDQTSSISNWTRVLRD